MGVYHFLMGKGIILSSKILKEIYRDELAKALPDFDIEESIREYVNELNELIEKIDIKFQICILGHDAFDSFGNRHDMGVLDGKNEKIYRELKNREDPDDDLVFIGICDEICGGDFSWYPTAPEIFYGLTTFLPQIVEYYPKLIKNDVSVLGQIFHQTPCIWTFTTDCCCCG